MNRKTSLIVLAMIFLVAVTWAQTTYTVGNNAELTAAITSAPSSGGVIEIANSFVVSGSVTINKSITINGNGYEISVPRPGLDDMGRYNSTPSTFRTFNISVSGTAVTMNDLRIKGGYVSASSGGAILVSDNTELTMNNCIVSSSRARSGGGIVLNGGVLYLNGSYLRRNAGEYGGGLLLTMGSRVYVENSTMIENRSTRDSGGGGAVECQYDTVIYFNNSTLANNQSTEIGGAINNNRGTVYFINSSATGNVAFGNFPGGAIGNNNGSVYIVNSLFAHNYRRTGGSVSDPSSYVLDDFNAYSAQSNVHIYYSVSHALLPEGMGTTLNNIQYPGLADGSDNSIFSGGILSKITDNDGNEIGDQIFRPFLYDNQGGVAPTLKPGSFITEAANRGTPTRFTNNNNVNPVIAYYDGSSYVDLLGTSLSGQEVLVDQVNQSRSTTAPSRGAIESETNSVLYIVKVNGASGGTITGGTIYGDVYAAGTNVSLTAIPSSGQSFVRWDYVSGGTGTASTDNPYTFSASSNVTLIPVFQASSGEYSIVYVGNGNTDGTPPASQTFTAPTTISDSGSLVRSGYSFVCWNTNSNGSGVSYSPAATYIDGVNLTLYAQWLRAAYDFPEDINTGHDEMVIHPSEDLNQDHNVDATHPIVTSIPNYPGLGAIKVLGLEGVGNNVSIDVTAPDGSWYGSIYFGGNWHFAEPLFIDEMDVSRVFAFTGVDFTAKDGEVIILLSEEDIQTLPIELSAFNAVITAQNYVKLSWVSESESNLLGYRVYRGESTDQAGSMMITPALITATNTSATAYYSQEDHDVASGSTYYYWLESVGYSNSKFYGPISVIMSNTGEEPQPPEIPLVTRLLPNFPNPFNPSTCIAYQLKTPETVKISIYNVRGQIVRSYVKTHTEPGNYLLEFDGFDNQGRAMSSGIYYCVMQTKSVISKNKMIMMK